MEALAQAGGENADHALMPRLVVQAQAVGVGNVDGLCQRQRRFLHAGLDVAALAIERIELFGQFRGPDRILRQQAFDADGHVGEPAGGVQPRTDHETEVIS